MSAEHPPLQHHPRHGALWMTVSMLCFTANALLLRLLATGHHADAWMALSFRAAIGLLVTALLFGAKGLHLRRSFQNWLLASRGVLGALGTAAYYTTIGPLGAGKATLIGNTWTVFAAIIAAFALRERLGIVKGLGILLALGGLALLTGMTPGSLTTFGRHEAIALTGAVLAAMVVVVIRQLTRTETSATIFASQCIYALLLGVPWAVSRFHSISPTEVALLSSAALCATCGQLAMTEGFRFLSVAAGGAFQVAAPLLITVSSIGIFGEAFFVTQAVGAAMILCGSFQTVLGGRKP